jgi:ABC-type dipeptide/oligopeptide/nickel transport system permease component
LKGLRLLEKIFIVWVMSFPLLVMAAVWLKGWIGDLLFCISVAGLILPIFARFMGCEREL